MATHAWRLWKMGEPLKKLEGISPLLASWNSKFDQAQVRLQKYLDELSATLRPVVSGKNGLFLHLDIDVQDSARFLQRYDLENYVTPVAYRLGSAAFKFVSARKQIGGGSRIVVGIAAAMSEIEVAGWQNFACSAGGGTQSKQWKARLRQDIVARQVETARQGPVEVHLGWHCSPARNWVWLWKPTGDAMGPILGESESRRFDPHDGRIVYLGLHLNVDAALRHAVDVGIWWRSALAQ